MSNPSPSPATRFKPGNGGRPKGSKNKFPQAVREMYRQALDNAGGVRYLTKLAKRYPVAFNQSVARMIPDEQKHDLGGEIVFRHPDLTQRAPERAAKVIQASEDKALEHRG